jgi:hypothetical protein
MQFSNRILKKELILLAGVLTIISGLLHLLPAAYTHWSAFPPLETIFFITLGLAQIIWAYRFIKNPNEWGYRLGLVLNGGTAFFWILTRTLPAPFQAGPEHVDLLSGVIFLLQLGAVISLLFWEEITDKVHLIRNTLFAIITMLMIGSGLYGVTNMMEWVFPERQFAHAHKEDEDHGQSDKSIETNEMGVMMENAENHMDEVENVELHGDEPKHVDDGHGH